jgi:hypothetical protein
LGLSRAYPQVEFLWWRECPSWERALADLRAAMQERGLDPQSLELIEIDDEEAAAREGFVGSPTIRVDGTDVQPDMAADEPVGLNCRIYRRRDGRVSPLPDPLDVRAALAAGEAGADG